MALEDTRDGRMSMIGLNLPVPSVMPDPDDNNWEDAQERQMGGLWLYHGISIQAAQPTMRRWGGIPYVRLDHSIAGRTW